jgi:maltose phosphorylase
VKTDHPGRFDKLVKKLNFDEAQETQCWKKIIDGMFYPYDEEHKVFLQQEGYLDKEQTLASEINPVERPINQHWSWDRILRSPFIKQADVLQGIYFFEEQYDTETIKRNFDFYEPRTVHESSLSACIHSILAAKIGDIAKAYELYLRTARLDLDDYNKEVSEGLHITSMGGTWMAIVEGFGGMRINNSRISFEPLIPENWDCYSFNVRFKGDLMLVWVSDKEVKIKNKSGNEIPIALYGAEYEIKPGQILTEKRIQIK